MIASLPATITELEAKAQGAAASPAEMETVKRELAKARASLQTCTEQRSKWSPEKFEKLSAREKSIHEKAFCTNVNDPAYHELATLRYRDGANERQMRIPKGDMLFQFRQDVGSGKLPAVSWIVAPEHLSRPPVIGVVWSVVHLRSSQYSHEESGGLEEDDFHPDVRRERRLLRPCSSVRRARSKKPGKRCRFRRHRYGRRVRDDGAGDAASRKE